MNLTNPKSYVLSNHSKALNPQDLLKLDDPKVFKSQASMQSFDLLVQEIFSAMILASIPLNHDNLRNNPTITFGVRDTLNTSQKILSNEPLTNLISAGNIFELGFFAPSSTGGSQRCLGIWYHMQEGSQQPQKQTVVWVANRDSPVAVGSIGVFHIAEDGNLEVVDTSTKEYWSSSTKKHFLSLPPKNRTVKLMDSGNLVLYNEHMVVKAYSYAPLHTDQQQRGLNTSNCWIWTQSLTTLKEEYTNWDYDRRLIVLVDKSEVAPTPRTCEPCGTNTVPYPLNTRPICADFTYFNFRCNISTGKLSFTANNNVFSPFYFANDNPCSEQVEVSWDPPSELVCDNFVDFYGWKHSTCSKGNKCLCNA
ncbi:D-mannose-binding lectin protein, partial [Medicago truncatula]